MKCTYYNWEAPDGEKRYADLMAETDIEIEEAIARIEKENS